MTTFVHPAPLETARLVVRPVCAADLQDLQVVNGDDEVTRYLPYATWGGPADAQAWLERMEKAQAAGSTLQWVIADKVRQQVVGACLLFQYDAGSARAELGYVLGRPWWGQGLMREALAALLDSAFGSLALRRIEAEVDPRNLASGALLRSLGFSVEGILRGRWVTKGRVCDVESFSLLRHEWQPANAAN
ncbi:MAG: GNAT family N-acetyltransferase [Burkholderiales bacterium PBB4]|nr:MAG: GNAT family N-acetyltransferase [Burkholderiales bacterium PBB4]